MKSIVTSVKRSLVVLGRYPNVEFWLLWLGATTLAMVVASFFGWMFGPPSLIAIVSTAAAQQWVLRKRTQDMRWWIPAACAGWMLLFIINQISPFGPQRIPQLGYSILLGFSVGLFQWFALRTEIKLFAWFIVATTLAYAVVAVIDIPDWLLTHIPYFRAIPSVNGALIGLIMGAVTGTTMTILLSEGRKSATLKRLPLEEIELEAEESA